MVQASNRISKVLLVFFLSFFPFFISGCGESGGGSEDTSEADSVSEDVMEAETPPCTGDGDCDDGVSCTEDSCQSGTCRHLVLHSRCDADEYCDPESGCVPSTPCVDDEDCVKEDPCAVGYCNDSTRTCRYDTFDGDEDGDPPRICGGTDCDDDNASIYGGAEERCNSQDDDCDGAVDEDFECIQDSTETCTLCGENGTRTCGNSCEWQPCEPPPESGLDCAVGEDRRCSTPCSTGGTEICDETCHWSGLCAPPEEECNGVDDDCDTIRDDGFECPRSEQQPCTTSCGSEGTRWCDMDCTLGSCTNPSETCNGRDDDCDGGIDEGFPCLGNESEACTTSCGSEGIRTCNASSCTWGACDPPDETCNGRDDDCDGDCDDGFGCCQGEEEDCTTTSGLEGSRTCSASCTWSACDPFCEALEGGECSMMDNCNCSYGWHCAMLYNSTDPCDLEELCMMGFPGDLPTGSECSPMYDECTLGNSCLTFGSENICMQWCHDDLDCDGGVLCNIPINYNMGEECGIVTSAYKLCCMPDIGCNPFTGAGCASPTGSCAFSPGCLNLVCEPVGTHNVGEDCSDNWQCVLGSECLSYGSSTPTCYRFCDSSHSCPSLTCRAFNPPYPANTSLGVCR